ncbi:MAG: undecaprenyl-diphosphate phosphatase [Bacteroidota bacterium]|nr:undecaprenyl-diphosphate phosphatase [Bacteroidota bacterium]
MNIFDAIIIAIVEGLTEFLPVSSTGHMIITSSLLRTKEDDFLKLFVVAIQLGSIMAVVLLYWQKFVQFNQWQFYAKLLAGVTPALLFGYFLNEEIDRMLGSEVIVAISLLAGGIVLVYIDKWFKQPVRNKSDLLAIEVTQSELIEADDRLTYKKAFIIGCWQVIAMIPGVSRSAASIIGGMQQKLTRNFAAEFSFFLAVPTMFAASAYSLFIKIWTGDGVPKRGYQLVTQSSENIYAFAVGNAVAFIVALLAIKFFITYLKVYGFRIFGIYRIALGLVLLILIAAGYL